MSGPSVHQRPPDRESLGRCAPGTEIARISWPAVTRTQLAYYCAATGVTDPIHFDLTAATRHGFTDVVVNGSYRTGMVELGIAMLWPDARIVEYDCRHRGVLYVGQPVQARVTLVSADGPRCRVRVDHFADQSLVDTSTITVEWQ